ncbi:MAG: vitamin K epoxide reductase family protein [Candidatus Aramenus sp.]|jgi:uncharacterized membrane protein|nr:vitamin K epoxide reductase family protein [Candidatus Aramenus sp.]
MGRLLDAFFLALCVAGVCISAYLTHETLSSSQLLGFCDVNSYVSCSAVVSSPFSRLFGVPVALLGLSWFSLMLVLWVAKRDWLVYPWLVGIFFVAYLVFTEVYFIHAICLLCSTAHAIALAMGYFVFKYSEEGAKRG